MSTRSPLPHLVRACLLAVTFCSLIFRAEALTPDVSGTALPPDPAGAPLPAKGGNQEPVEGKNTTGKEKTSDHTDTLANKPMVIHAERDAEIGRMVGELMEQGHYLHLPINADISQKWMKNYLMALDSNHLFFLQSDIDEFNAKYGNTLGELLLKGENYDDAIKPAFEIFARYRQRAEENITLAEKLTHDQFDFTKDETFTVPTSKSPWLKDAAASSAMWRDSVKSELLAGLLDKKAPEETIKRLNKRYDSLLKDREEMDDMDVLETYLRSLTEAYDPHSDYMAPDEATNFDMTVLHHAVTGIGAVLRSDDGYATIEEIIAGGPADLDKRLQAGDRIIAVGQGTKEPVDAIDMKLNRVVDMIRGAKGSSVHLVVLPAGAADSTVHKDIILTRDTVSIKDSLAKAEIINHPLPDGTTEKLGVVTLHDFYQNTAADCEKLIRRLKQEKVAGIILDFRNNGGGLLDQAVDLTGLFVTKQPVVQIRRSDGLIDQLDCESSRVLYGGPLLVMVNKASASATEIVAGALQDYGRAIIVGDQSTHGKGTVQTLIPLDQQAPLGFTGDPGKLKLTIQKFYRVAGGSTQQKGVIPDIVLPSVLDALELGETTLPNYLPYDTIPAVKFDYLNLTEPFLAGLQAQSQARVAASRDFGYVRQDIEFYKKKVKDTTVSLNLATRLKEQDDLKALAATRKKDLQDREAGRDKMLDLTLDMVDGNLPPIAHEEKKRKVSMDDSDGVEADPGASADNPTDDPQLDESVKIMCDYTKALRDSGSALVDASRTSK